MRYLFIKLFNYLFKGYVLLWQDKNGYYRIDICEPNKKKPPLVENFDASTDYFWRT